MTESIITLPLDAIQADTRAQSRAEIDMVVVGEYADDMKSGATFPPLVVFHDQAAYWLAEGFHRYHAYQQAEITPVPVLVKAGGLREAILQSLGSNADHGKRRTNADKRRAVEMMLRDSEWSGWSDREIARQCAVSHEFVRQIRPDICQPLTDSQKKLAKSSSGKTYTINTGNIGKKTEPVAPMIEDDPPFEAEFEDEDGNPVSFPAVDDEEAQFLAELDAEAAALDEVPPVVGAVTEKTCLSCRHYTSEMNDLHELISEVCNAPLPLFVEQGLRRLDLDYKGFFWDSYSAGAFCNAHMDRHPSNSFVKEAK